MTVGDSAVHYDVVVIGSGFGGSVTALRLTEKGYRVGVLEAGRRIADHEFAENSWHLRKYVWAPKFGCFGIQRMTLLKDTFLVSGAGVGGGSLTYANTLYEPPAEFFEGKQWGHITDWRAELAPHYDQARRMLGVTTNPVTTPSDEVLREVAEEIGVGSTYCRTPVGVFFGPNGAAPGQRVPDPFFGGVGPERKTCINCGECLTGCRHGAKNTLVKNYLYLAEKSGATVHPLTTATTVRPRANGGYAVETVRTGRWVKKLRQTFTADEVVFAAAALGTQRLLHRMRDDKVLPNISSRLGELTRTNSEAIVAARAKGGDTDYSAGVAITSSIHPDAVTHIETGRFGGRGSNFMYMMFTVMADPRNGIPRWAMALREYVRNRRDLVRMHIPAHASEQTVGLLVMQTLDNSLTTYTKRGLFGRRMTTKQGAGEPNPTSIPIANEVARRIADKIDGVPQGSVTELINVPMTGHFLGGCPIGDSPNTGVVDAFHRLYGHAGLHVVDGSTISANLGVNPSLTIAAQAERAMSLWPNKGDKDMRPAMGQPYRRVDPIAPRKPIVPVSAVAAYRPPIRTVQA
jgi:cholesterol oxidase